MHKPEILAPAGSIESLRGAVAAGADAVYIGGSRFGARAYADNPQEDELLAAIDYVHSKNRKIYMTVNTLLKEEELESELYDFIRTYYEGGVDAIIVQDVGVLHFLAAQFPKLPLHASTQMTIVSGDGVKMLSDYPVTRIVPARELGFSELKELRQETALEIETFVHGALCYCYSGQCLFSSMIGGRSGNRGRCAQPCRMEYTLLSEGRRVRDGYLLSPKDMCTLDQIPKLIEAGIDSFKIEGRMKRPEYTAGVTAAYRKMTDLYWNYGVRGFEDYIKKNPQLLQEEIDRVSDLYNRGGFSKGYYASYHGKQMMTMDRPNHSGVKVGEVAFVKGIQVGIRLEKEVSLQDVLEIRVEEHGKAPKAAYEFTVGKAGMEQLEQERVKGNQQAVYKTNVKPGFPATVGLPVYRTKNEQLLNRLKEQFLDTPLQMPVTGTLLAYEGKPLQLTVELHAKGTLHADIVTVTGDMVDVAKNQPVTAEKLAEQLKKTGESEFFFEQLKIESGDHIFVPMGSIKELRRKAFAQLSEQKIAECHREPVRDIRKKSVNENKAAAKERKPETVCLVSTKEQLVEVNQCDFVSAVYLDLQELSLSEQTDLARETERLGKQAFLVLPHIFRTKERKRYEKELKVLGNGGFSGFLAKSLEELTFLKEHVETASFEVRLNYNLYTINQEAKQFFFDAGYSRFTASVELNDKELDTLSIKDSDLIIYGRLPLMISAQCLRDNVMECSHGKQMAGIELCDRKNAKFPVRQICSSCYNVIYNSACTSLLGSQKELEALAPLAYRLDFVFESGEETKRVLLSYETGESGRPDQETSYTKGHLKRGIL